MGTSKDLPEGQEIAAAPDWSLVVRWPVGHARAALDLRGWPGVQVALGRQYAWLRFPGGAGDGAVNRCARLPGAELFLTLESGEVHGQALHSARLRGPKASDGSGGEALEPRGRVPGAKMPSPAGLDLPWRDLASWGEPQPIGAAIGATQSPLASSKGSAPAQLRLVRGGVPRDPCAVIVGLGALCDWADFAPASRLEPLVFAARNEGDGQALVLGRPLPPVAGTLLWEESWTGGGGALIPCGHRPEPALPGNALLRVFAASNAGAQGHSVESQDRVLMTEAGWEPVQASAWVRMNRASLRATREALGPEAQGRAGGTQA